MARQTLPFDGMSQYQGLVILAVDSNLFVVDRKLNRKKGQEIKKKKIRICYKED